MVYQADLEIMILLLQSPECWDYMHVPPCPASNIYLFMQHFLETHNLTELLSCFSFT
jgi:hypothetical protein